MALVGEYIAWGAQLSAALYTDEGRALYPNMISWSRGGCDVLATALRGIIPNSSRWVVFMEESAHLPQHYLVMHKPTRLMFDGRGAQTKDQAWEFWHRQLGEAQYSRTKIQRPPSGMLTAGRQSHYTSCDTRSVKRVREFIQTHVRPFPRG